jgi:hypothetical protein
VPETAHTTAILIRLCVAIDVIDAAWVGAGRPFIFFLLPLVASSLQASNSPEMAGQAL